MLLGIGVTSVAAPASADPGHVRLNCNTYTSTGWYNMYYGGINRGSICMTIHSHGDHVDVTYESIDGYADGIDIIPERDLSFVNDGWSQVAGPWGAGTHAYSNKQYPIGSSLRWVQMRGWLDPGYTVTTTKRLYW